MRHSRIASSLSKVKINPLISISKVIKRWTKCLLTLVTHSMTTFNSLRPQFSKKARVRYILVWTKILAISCSRSNYLLTIMNNAKRLPILWIAWVQTSWACICSRFPNPNLAVRICSCTMLFLKMPRWSCIHKFLKTGLIMSAKLPTTVWILWKSALKFCQETDSKERWCLWPQSMNWFKEMSRSTPTRLKSATPGCAATLHLWN